MKGLLILSALLASGQNVPFLGDAWTMFCTGEKATGFNYRSGEWVQTNFKPAQYVIARKPDLTCNRNSPLLVDRLSDSFVSREACVNIKEVGDEESPLMTARCTEYYTYNDAKWSRSFSCSGIFANFKAEFDGEFVRQTDSTIMRAAKTRDSIVSEVGRCALVNG